MRHGRTRRSIEFGDARIAGIAGNYDSTVGLDYKHCGCKYEDPRQAELAHLSFEWTKQHVSASVKHVLASLPFRLDLRPLGGHLSGPTVILVHGAPTLNTLYLTEDRTDDFLSRMAEIAGAKTGDVLCFGHTHLPWHRTIEGIHFLNTGSVGRPKDGDWRAGYVILDVDKSDVKFEFVRVEYDIDAAVKAIQGERAPGRIRRLSHRWRKACAGIQRSGWGDGLIVTQHGQARVIVIARGALV